MSQLATETDIKITSSGWLQRELKQLSASVSIEGSADGTPLKLGGDLIVAGENEIYLNVRELTSSDPKSPLRSPFFNLIMNQWWKLPSKVGDSPVNSVTPDPRLLDLQSQAIVVTKDYGVTTLNDRLSYHYDTTIDQKKLMTYMEEIAKERKEEFDPTEWNDMFTNTDMKGSVWIDAETFRINKMTWNITSKKTDKVWALNFDITFSDHDNAPNVMPPAGAKELPSLPGLLEGLPLQGTEGATGMPEEMQQELLDSLLKTN